MFATGHSLNCSVSREMRRDSKIVINTGRPGCGKSAVGFDLISSENHEPVGLDPVAP
jgi:hypothetical protein